MGRDKLAIAGFLVLAILIGGAVGYFAYWARQEAVATFTDDVTDEEQPVTVRRGTPWDRPRPGHLELPHRAFEADA